MPKPTKPRTRGRPPKHSPAKVREVLRLRKRGKSWAEVARLTGVPQGTAEKMR